MLAYTRAKYKNRAANPSGERIGVQCRAVRGDNEWQELDWEGVCTKDSEQAKQ